MAGSDKTARRPGEVIDGRRICPRCKLDQRLEDYSPRNNICKPCKAEHKRLRALADPNVRESRRLYSAAYNAAHAERQREAAREWRRSNPEAVRKQSSARRAQLAGAAVEDFLPVEIFDRDGWTCHICGHGISLVVRWPHPLSVSLDHIRPLARGGDHSRANTAASHLGCNLRKYASVTQD